MESTLTPPVLNRRAAGLESPVRLRYPWLPRGGRCIMSHSKKAPSEIVRPERSGLMPHTPWTMLFHARGNDPAALEHLGEVLRLYWRPLRVCIERRGFGPHESEDLTQEFISRLLRKGSFDDVDPNKGRLRSYLLTGLNHFLSNVRRERAAQRRGGGQAPLSLDAPLEDGGAGEVAADDPTPDSDFDREWAYSLIENVICDLRAEFSAQGKAALFEALQPGLMPDGSESGNLSDLGNSVGLNAGATRVALHRLRLRFRNLLYRHVAATVGSEEEIEDEVRGLILRQK
jgi:RNA polymerase sigma-70 factor (ECF subfamily)